MSFCSQCGTQIKDDNQQFCTNCGAPIETAELVARETMAYDYHPSMQNQYSTPVESVIQYPMKWFKFLIYFMLFFGAAVNFVIGVNYMTGGIYVTQTDGQVTADAVYSIYGGGLQMLDILYGIIMVAMAGFGVYTRFRLAKYKTNGPICIYIMYGAGVVLSLFYNVALFVVTGLNQIFSSSIVTSALVSGLLIFWNYKYFTKRKELFVN